MTKDVLVAVSGLQFDVNNDKQVLETISTGEYFKKNDSHYVIYEEMEEGSGKSIKNVIKFREHSMDLTKKGVINVHMIFEEQKKNMTNYQTPYGGIMIGIDTSAVKIKEEENRIKVEVDYALEANYEHLAQCKISIDIREKNGEEFRVYS